jgi:protein SCO1/2
MMALRSRPGLLGLAAGVLVLLASAAAVAILGGQRQGPEAPVASLAAQPGALKAGVFDPPQEAPDFSLPGSDGSKVTLARYRGKVVLLTFGFTYCAAVCPTTMSTLAQAHARLGKAAKDVQVIFVTVDPDRDDAASMRTFLAAFDPTFIGATGEPAELAKVREKYGVTAVRQGTGSDYAIAHTSSIFLIDRDGKLRAMMPFGHDAADFAHDVRILLNA